MSISMAKESHFPCIQQIYSLLYTAYYSRSALRLTGTHYSCISRVGAGTSIVGGRKAALGQSQLCPWTIHIAIPGWTTSSSKVSRPGSFNCYRIAQLMAHNCSFSKVPVVVTHSAPLPKEKDLNTTFQQSIPSHQSYRAFCSCVIWCYICRSKDIVWLIRK